MKKTFILFFIMLATVAMGQQKSFRTEKYTPKVNFADNVFPFENQGTFSYYYDENDNKVLHGKKSGGGQIDFRNRNGAMVGTYSEEMNYADGILNGSLIVKGDLTLSTKMGGISLNVKNLFQINGSYKDGLPHGNWNISTQYSLKQNGQPTTIDAKWIYKYENGDIVGYKYDGSGIINNINGKELAEFSKNKLGAWTIRATSDFENINLTVINGIKIGSFIGMQGNEREVDEEQRIIIEELVKSEGNYDMDALLSKGYTLEKRSEQCNGNKISDNAYDYTYFDRGSNFRFRFQYEYYILRRAKVASLEDIKASINTLMDNALIDNYSENEYNLIKEDINYGYFPKLRISGKLLPASESYMKPSDKQAALDYLEKKYSAIKKAKEDKRIAEEKAEDERRQAEYSAWVKKQKETAGEYLNKLATPWTEAKGSFSNWLAGANNFLVGYKFLDIAKGEYSQYGQENRKALLDYYLYTKGSKEKGYSKYRVKIEVSDGRVVNFQRDFNAAKKVNSLYDTVVAMEETLLATLDNDNLSDVKKVYKKKHLLEDIEANSFTEYVHKLVDQRLLINYCNEFASLRKEIAQNHDELSKRAKDCSRCKDIASLYNSYYKTIDLAWKPEEDKSQALENLKSLIKNQETYLHAMAEHKTIETISEKITDTPDCKPIVKAYSAYFKEAEKAWEKTKTADELVTAFTEIQKTQQYFEDCIKQYNIVAGKDKSILEKSKQCKNIVSIYKDYIKTCEKEWSKTTDPKVLQENLEKTLTVQESVLSAVSGSDATELDQKVKQAKCKNMDALLSTIK